MYATIERVAATVRQHGEHHPPAQLDVLLGPTPASPHLAHRYRALAGNLAVLDAATNAPRRRRPLDVLEQALGVRPAGQAAGAEWDRLADQACQLAVDITVHALRDTPDGHRRSPWLVAYLERCAHAGTLADRDTTKGLVEQIRGWRTTHGVDDSDLCPLGERPADPSDRARYDALTADLDHATIDCASRARDDGRSPF